MSRVRVKVCGITRVEDARAAIATGADALGFVLWPSSPRAIHVAAAAAIARDLPAMLVRVGVFVNASPEEVDAAVRQIGLGAVQLHGDERVDDYMGLRVPLIKAVSMSSAGDVERVLALPANVSVLVDAVDADRRGGTGRLASWAHAAGVARARPVILAGGLTADNVGDAIRRVGPWAVDVSSGVESAPGVKNPARIEEFFAALAKA
jgi:phosphoribosylanthranilate isomerase